MSQEQVHHSLRELHEQLQGGKPVDPETLALLQQLSQDVDALTLRATGEVPTDEPPPQPEEKDSLLDRLLSLTEEFEESHPQLAESIGRVASALSRIGI